MKSLAEPSIPAALFGQFFSTVTVLPAPRSFSLGDLGSRRLLRYAARLGPSSCSTSFSHAGQTVGLGFLGGEGVEKSAPIATSFRKAEWDYLA